MKTVFFPFTTLHPLQAERLAADWGPVILLQPSVDTVLPVTRRLEKAGFVELVYPPGELPEGGLQGTLETFERWAVQYTGSDRGALREQVHRNPIRASQFAAQLATEIRKGGRTPEETPETAEQRALLQAQLFLAMAQKLDRQQADLSRDILALAAEEKKMLALLKGEDGIAEIFSATSKSAASDSATVMLEERLKTWARVMANTDFLARDGALADAEYLFMTDASDLPVHLQEVFPEMVYRWWCQDPVEANTPKRDGVELPAWLDGKRRPVSDAPGFDLIEIPATAPSAFLSRLAGLTRSSPAAALGDAPASTWVGCLPPPHDPVVP